MSFMDAMMGKMSGMGGMAMMEPPPGMPLAMPEEENSPFPPDEDIVADVNSRFDKFKYGRSGFERNWYESILFRHGNQWVIRDETSNTWRKQRLQAWVPTPVTNKYASTGERVASVLSRIQPNWNFVPASESENDIIAAKKCDLLEPIICEENKTEKMRSKIAKWLTYTGNCFGFSNVEEKGEGFKQYTDIYSPFEVYGNAQIEDIDNHECIIICTLKDKDYIKKKWGVDAENAEIKEASLNYLETIAYISQNNTFKLSTNEKIKGVLIKIAVIRPCEMYPEGIVAFIQGNTVLEKSAFVKTPDGEFVFPVEHWKFDSVPGSWYASTPMFDLVPKQRQRNRVESMMELIIMRMSNPVWTMPEGTTVKGFSGEPGAVIKYQSMGDKQGAPNRLAGENVPSSSFAFFDKIDKDFEEIASTFEALKGQAPYSGAPNVAIETLIEQGLTRFGPALMDIAETWRRWMKTQLELFRVYGGSRTLVKMGDGGEWDINKFDNADFGAVNVRIESDSSVPRNEYVKQAKIGAGIEMKLIDITNPMVKLKAMQKLKLEDFAEDTEKDVIAAARENELLLQIPPEQLAMMPEPPIKVTPFLDNHDIMIPKHRNFANSEKGKPYREFMMKHITEHHMMRDAEMNGGMDAPQQPGAPAGNDLNKKDQAALAPQGDEVIAGAMSPEVVQ